MKKQRETTDTMGVFQGSGNVFADLGLPNAEEEMAKAQLAMAVRRRIAAMGLTQTEAAEILGTDQTKVSLLTNGKVSGFTLDRLTRFLNALEMDVQITVVQTPDRRPGRMLVTTG